MHAFMYLRAPKQYAHLDVKEHVSEYAAEAHFDFRPSSRCICVCVCVCLCVCVCVCHPFPILCAHTIVYLHVQQWACMHAVLCCAVLSRYTRTVI
jgi:hypothetical protein